MLARHPICLLFLSIGFFLICDNLVFRSGLYDLISSPEPLTGQLYNTVHYEKLRPLSGKKEILLIGNSRTHWGIWTKLLNMKYANTPFEFVQFGIAGSYEKMWYYILKAVDPKQQRYAAIVLPTVGYKIDSWSTDQENSYDNATMLAPIMKLKDWPSLLESFSDQDTLNRAATIAIFSSHNYAGDIQDLILHPCNRWFLLRRRKNAGSSWLYDWGGTPGSMESAAFDADGQIISFPKQLSSFEKEEATKEFTRPTTTDAALFTSRNAQYQIYWLNKIVDLYKDSPTKIIFIQIPRWPIPLPARSPIKNAPDLRTNITKLSNVFFVDENAFVSFEKPKYFYDALHLNDIGRHSFTESFGTHIIQIMGQDK